ncbi:NADH:ubiquinone reductase (Na(+)-transporting) subunit B [Chlamydiia bacterium]|jgi:Na+-transporting NADH:ubiquinone oxidoreductase subunit B|nr:NADH:ubiquinone reductase (Na(+)-transporting) subunit B [Chlamydiia bacterium]
MKKYESRSQKIVKRFPRLEWAYPLFTAGETFLFKALEKARHAPFIRDCVDLKRWMSIVVLALAPCILMAIWNTGVQKLVYESGDLALMQSYITQSTSFSGYLSFVTTDGRYLNILLGGAMTFVPIMIISYGIGGLVESIFACLRKHDIAEGFLVTGMLYPLILPPTIPYWITAVGIFLGIVISKEIFGGTGMNFFNPALTARCLLFFGYPLYMAGDIWVGSDVNTVTGSLKTINQTAGLSGIASYSSVSPLGIFNNTSDEVKRIHIDAIAENASLGTSTAETIGKSLTTWSFANNLPTKTGITDLSTDQLRSFVTGAKASGGLGLSPDLFNSAYDLSTFEYGFNTHLTNATLFFGNHMGSMGETSTLACIIGAFILIITRVGSYRTMLGVVIGATFTAMAFQYGTTLAYSGDIAWSTARYTLPFYKHFLVGSLAFGLVFMATDPVSSPSFSKSRWIYGFLIGVVTIIIRVINPAYPEGVMLAILFGNSFAPMIDRYMVRRQRGLRFG